MWKQKSQLLRALRPNREAKLLEPCENYIKKIFQSPKHREQVNYRCFDIVHAFLIKSFVNFIHRDKKALQGEAQNVVVVRT